MASKPRSYRELQADGERELTECPKCRYRFAPHEVDAKAPPTPSALPERAPHVRRERARQHAQVTGKLQAAMRALVTDSTYFLWLAPLRVVDSRGGTLYVAAPEEIRTWVGDRFGRILAAAAEQLAGRPILVEIIPTTAVDADTLAAAAPGDEEDAPDPTRRSEPGASATLDQPADERSTACDP